ncbi:MAG: antibiotic biosynthesis monooxygenase [Bauldia sp.]
MFIAMNRFKVARGSEAEFEAVWRARERRLDELPGFRDFHLLRGPQHEDHTLYASHTMWESEDAFVNWTKSEQFRAVHRDAGANKVLYIGHPQFEGFTALEGV